METSKPNPWKPCDRCQAHGSATAIVNWGGARALLCDGCFALWTDRRQTVLGMALTSFVREPATAPTPETPSIPSFRRPDS